MKIVFYHELAAAPGVGLKDVLDGSAPGSGGMGRIWVAVEIAKLGNEVFVFHRGMAGPEVEHVFGITMIRVASDCDFVNKVGSISGVDFIVINYYEHAPALIKKMAAMPARKILWAGCNPPFEWCELLDQTRLHRMICVSDICREPFRLHGNFRWVDYIYSSINSSVAIPSPSEPIPGSVIFLGALRREKGFHHVLKAWPLIREKMPDARLQVCGSIRLHFPDAKVGRTGVLTPEFEKQYLDPWIGETGDWREHGLEFLYPLSKQELFDRLARATVGIVNPNLSGSTETFCLSAVEMQACGCPSIGGGVDGLLETIKDKESGFHLRTQNPEELSGKIIDVLTNRELRAKLSQGALLHSSHFASSAREARDWIAMFKRSLQSIPSESRSKYYLDVARALGAGRCKMVVKRLLKYFSYET